MSERIFMMAFGTILLVALYFELDMVMYALVVLLVFEGVTNLRLSQLLVSGPAQKTADAQALTLPRAVVRFDFEAQRAWRLVMAVMLSLSILFYDQAWFLGWFLGFAVAGAGLSGVCPVLFMLYKLGFK